MVSDEEIVRNDLVIVVSRMRKCAADVAVTQGPEAGYVRLQLIINDNVASLVGCNPGPIEIQVVRDPGLDVGRLVHRLAQRVAVHEREVVR